MATPARRASLTASFNTLLRDLAPSWPAADIAHVRDVADHFEFDDALENLVALALDRGTPLTPSQRRRVADMAAKLRMVASPVLARLRTRFTPARPAA